MPLYATLSILFLLVAVITLVWFLFREKIKSQRLVMTPAPAYKVGLLTKKGPHTIEILDDLHVYNLPIGRLQEFPEIKISVLVPSRSRPDLLKKSLRTVIELADDPNSIQVIIRSDLCDKYMKGFEFPECKNLKIVRGERMKGYASLHFFYTQCAMHASGSLLVLWNDDAQMITRGWDKLLLKETANEREKEIPGFWALSNNHWPYAFPVITRCVTERLGAFARFSYNDAYLHQLARASGIEQRVLENVRVQHDMPEGSGWDGKSYDLYQAGFFNDIIHADAKLLAK